VISSKDIKANNRIVRKNIILNAIGAYAGAESNTWEPYGKAAGIYLDDYTNNVEVTDNTVGHGVKAWAGILVNGGSDIQIKNNTVYNFPKQIWINAFAKRIIKGLVITDNKFVSGSENQKTMYLQLWENYNPASFGNYNRNYYAGVLDGSQSITLDKQFKGGGGANNISLATWQSTFKQDINSNKAPVKVAFRSSSTIRLEYNATNVAKVILLDGPYVDVDNKRYTNKISLHPYSSLILFKTN
jgi:hypothetical protein